MVSHRVGPETLEEKLIYWSIVCIWPMYLMGALYVVMPALAWVLLAVSLLKQVGAVGDEEPSHKRLPAGVMLWAGGMATMVAALFVGLAEEGLGILIKSFIGWMKGWAMMAIFIYVGATLRIRPAVIYRAANVLAAHTLALTPIFLIAGLAGLPRMQYYSVLEILGGSTREYFNVELYSVDPESRTSRWSFFCPWAPAAGMIGNMFIVFAYFDRDTRWKAVGLAAGFLMCMMSQSRLAVVIAPVLGVVIWCLSNVTRSMVFSAGSVVCMSMLPFIDPLIRMIDEAQERFKNARASSSRVRATLQSIARHRWWNEAPIWGHGTVERGPHLVEYMPIGSHHTWNGLLFVKGAVGFTALAIPMAWTVCEMLVKAQSDRVARAGLGVVLIVLLYSFAENLETLIYLYWPGMVIIGIAMKRRFVQPFHTFMVR
jgi:hypothetical protein